MVLIDLDFVALRIRRVVIAVAKKCSLGVFARSVYIDVISKIN